MAGKRWDPIVKLTHWGIAAAVVGNALITEEGSGWHIWIGYGLASLLALRLLWGLVGPREARFAAFPPSLARASRHLREIGRGEVTQHASHNPLGALMVYAIWAALLVVIVTGLAMSGPPPANPSAKRVEQADGGGQAEANGAGEREEVGELEAEDEGGEGGEEGPLGEVHELSVNLLYVLIALHLMGVAFESRRSSTAIVRAMLPGEPR